MSNQTVADTLRRLGIEVHRYKGQAPPVELYTGVNNGYGPRLTELSEAEAAMLAAELAPDLLEALKECSEWMREHTGPRDGTLEILTRAHHALEKAEGRST